MDKAAGIIGLGIMGSAMAASLMREGYRVAGYDVDPGRGVAHRNAGGVVARTCRDVATFAPVLITSLPSPDALLQTALALAEAGRSGQVVIETSTLSIAAKEDARRRLSRRGITLLDCPLSGTGAQARVKDVIVYASGDRAAYHRASSVLDGFTRARYYVGAFGCGSKMKFVANLLVAIHNVAAAEAMVLAMKAGLDPAMTLKVISDGAGNSRMLQARGPMMVKGDYSGATMKMQVWQKDMAVIGEFARELACPTPLFAATGPLYSAALAMGYGAQDTASVCAVLEQMADSPRQRTRVKKQPPGKKSAKSRPRIKTLR